MGILSRLFGPSKPSIPREPLNFEIQKGWFRSDADIKKISEYLSNHPSLHIIPSQDPMDDSNILTLSLVASQFECVNLSTPPVLTFRARKSGPSIILESFIHFKDNFFARRGKNPTVRLRFDEEEPIICGEGDTEYSTNKSSLFLARLDPFQKSLISNIMRIQILPERGESVLATFDFVPVRAAFEFFAEAICGPDFREIVACNPKLLDFILRMGPKNILTYKKALSALRLNPGPADYTKGIAFFKTIQSYAESRHAWEITGNIGSATLNNWFYLLSKEVPSRIRQEIGALNIFD